MDHLELILMRKLFFNKMVINSDIKVVNQKAKKFGYPNPVLPSNRKFKKYMIEDEHGKMHHFGDTRYEDYTKHKDKDRRDNYLKRSSKIKGDWKTNKYSPNRLSRDLLW